MAKKNRYFEDEKTAKISKSSLFHALKFMVPYKKAIITLGIGMLIISFIALLPTRIMSLIVDNVLTKEGMNIFGAQLDWVTLAVVLISCYALASLSEVFFTIYRIRTISKVGHGVVHDIRYAVYNNLQKLAFDYYDSRPNGKILVRATTYLDELATAFSSSIMIIFTNVFKIIFILVWMFAIDVVLTGVTILAIIPMIVILSLLRKSLTRCRRSFREKRSNRTAYIAESIQGQQIINAFNRKEKNEKIFKNLNDDVCNRLSDWSYRNELVFPVMDGFFYVGLIAVYWVILALSMGGNYVLTVGAIISFISYSSMLSGPINEVTTQLQEVINAVTNLESVMEVIETEPTVKDEEDATTLPPIEGRVEYDHVTFGYEDTIILDDLTFSVEKGKTVAFVGPTGAGKSTIVNLLTRFYNLNSGKILIDGHDVSKVTLHSLRSQIGVMMQDSFIFSGTIIDNIRYGRPDATDEECIEVAKAVRAHDFITQLPNGYYTETVEQGAQLSTGERQLISFARVLLINPKILILDEATSSIDTQTEELIQNALDVILKGRTSFIIAHRLSTIKKADCIMYIANKGIAEAGTHNQLMEKKGLYYNLIESSKNKSLTSENEG